VEGVWVASLVAVVWGGVGLWQGRIGAAWVLGMSWLVGVPWLVAGVLMRLGVMGNVWDVTVGVEDAVWLVPAGVVVGVWAVQRVYAGSWLARVAYRAPWRLGFVVAVPCVAAGMAMAPSLRPVPPPVVGYAQEVVADVLLKGLKPVEGFVAVQGVPSVARAVVGQGLGLPWGQPVVLEEGGGLKGLQTAALERGVGLVWQGSAVAGPMMGVVQPLDVSVLYAVTPDAMVVRGLYPLPFGE
ncbi:MAG: hypothetical protein WAZ18_04045, partial [Alphaproteobacteria bacterium]